MSETGRRTLPLFDHLPLLMLAVAVALFSVLSRGFLTPRNLANILTQSASLAVISVGMTFVLLTAGIDLSAGAVMFLAAACAGKLLLAGWPAAPACAAAIAAGALVGWLNGLLVARLKVLAFIATLAVLYMGRGLGLFITRTRAMNLTGDFLLLGSGRLLGVALPVWIMALAVVAAHFVLTRTVFGRQLYAAGADAKAAAKAGIPVARLLMPVYVASGVCAAVGGLVSVAQLGAVSPTFGINREFEAIAAAVLGGVSLFGGRGRIFPGAVAGALLIQTIQDGLVMMNADPYMHPLVTAVFVFIAVLLDSVRTAQVQKLNRRKIRPLD